ncbi:TRAP transporter small permease [Roseovarius sp.]|uniref:TRAP transporter small permease n=1 Tax=Roseovarius sp. TaxID=1486281 RepID=UPI003518B167
MLQRFFTWFEIFVGWLAAFCAVIVLLMSAWISYDVLARNFFGIGSPWFFDLSEYALVWITFLAAPWVLMQDKHVRIELLIDELPTKLQRIIGIAVSVLAFLTCVVLLWKTSAAAIQYYENNVMMARIWRIPRVWPYIAIPIGSGLLAIAFLARLHHYITSSDPETDLRVHASGGEGGLPKGEV